MKLLRFNKKISSSEKKLLLKNLGRNSEFRRKFEESINSKPIITDDAPLLHNECMIKNRKRILR